MRKTDLTAHVTQADGYWYERRVYTDGIRNYIKVNGEHYDLYDFEKNYFIESIETFYNPVGR
jgi:hypothetical protein